MSDTDEFPPAPKLEKLLTEPTVFDQPITARFIEDPDTQTLGDDFQVLRPIRLQGGGTILAYYAMSSKAGIALIHQGAGPDHRFITADVYWVVNDDTGVARWDVAGSNIFPGLEGEHEAWQDFAKRALIVITDSEDD
jgi:hypothetical protein